jgi:DNA-binding HxlR family transcriptional regulator
MKSQKITLERAARPRWYDDACGTALALELVGERWSLLIVRELMFGGRRFGELKAALTGISANVLSQRLESLERAGIALRHRPPGAAQRYDLTPWGRESEPAIQALGRWAVRSPAHDPRLPLSAASLMLSFRTMYRGADPADWGLAIGFRLGTDAFVATPGRGDFAVRRDDPAGAELVFDGGATAVAALVYGGVPLAELTTAGALAVTGDGALAGRFATWFPLPAKVGAAA